MTAALRLPHPLPPVSRSLAAAAHPDAALLTYGAALDRATARLAPVIARMDEGPISDDEWAAYDAADNRANTLRLAVADTPAHTLDGFAVKGRTLRQLLGEDFEPEELNLSLGTVDQRLAWSMVAGLAAIPARPRPAGPMADDGAVLARVATLTDLLAQDGALTRAREARDARTVYPPRPDQAEADAAARRAYDEVVSAGAASGQDEAAARDAGCWAAARILDAHAVVLDAWTAECAALDRLTGLPALLRRQRRVMRRIGRAAERLSRLAPASTPSLLAKVGVVLRLAEDGWGEGLPWREALVLETLRDVLRIGGAA